MPWIDSIRMISQMILVQKRNLADRACERVGFRFFHVIQVTSDQVSVHLRLPSELVTELCESRGVIDVGAQELQRWQCR